MKKSTIYQQHTHKEVNNYFFLLLVMKSLSFAFAVTIMLLAHFWLDNRQRKANKGNEIKLQNIEHQTLRPNKTNLLLVI